MTHELRFPPMSRRRLELLFLLVDNFSDPLAQDKGTIIRYELFAEVSPGLNKETNIRTALSYVKPVLEMYGFYLTNVPKVGYMCHRSLSHVPDRFDRRFHGAQKIERISQ